MPAHPTSDAPLPCTAPASLLTNRLRLRAWQPADRAPFAAMNQDAEVMRYFPALQTPAASGAAIAAWQHDLLTRGWSNFAVEWRARSPFIGFIGFIGLTVPKRLLPFSPCVEVGWRLLPAAWGHGLATEGAAAVLGLGLGVLALAQVVSFTARLNVRSEAVMQRLGMQRDTADDFEHPGVPAGHPLRPHVLYRMTQARWHEMAGT